MFTISVKNNNILNSTNCYVEMLTCRSCHSATEENCLNMPWLSVPGYFCKSRTTRVQQYHILAIRTLHTLREHINSATRYLMHVTS